MKRKQKRKKNVFLYIKYYIIWVTTDIIVGTMNEKKCNSFVLLKSFFECYHF